MTKPTTEELQAMAREAFGRTLSAREAEAYRGRLPTMAQNIQRLREWTPRLRTAEPALVQRVPPGEGDE